MTPTEEKTMQKASAPQTPQAEGTSHKKSPDGKHPVLLYILILFVAAFLLMGLSFLSSQHRNNQTLGEIQDSMTALQNVQYDQQRIIELQDELSQAQSEIEALENQLSEANDALKENEKMLEQSRLDHNAKQMLFRLHQSYLAKDYETCRTLIEVMEFNDCVSRLDWEVPADACPTSPRQLYEQIKEAVETHK